MYDINANYHYEWTPVGEDQRKPLTNAPRKDGLIPGTKEAVEAMAQLVACGFDIYDSENLVDADMTEEECE